MKIAAIDIGTNSIHMVIVRVEEHRIFEIDDREKEMLMERIVCFPGGWPKTVCSADSLR